MSYESIALADNPAVLVVDGNYLIGSVTGYVETAGTASYIAEDGAFGEVRGFIGNQGTSKVTISNVPHTPNSQTAELWIKQTGTKADARPFAYYHPSGGLTHILIKNNVITARFGTASFTTITGPTITNGEWYHIALTIASGLGILYVNGVEVGRANGATSQPNTTGSLFWGMSGSASSGAVDNVLDRHFVGFSDNIAYYNHALTAERIAAHWNFYNGPQPIVLDFERGLATSQAYRPDMEIVDANPLVDLDFDCGIANAVGMDWLIDVQLGPVKLDVALGVATSNGFDAAIEYGQKIAKVFEVALGTAHAVGFEAFVEISARTIDYEHNLLIDQPFKEAVFELVNRNRLVTLPERQIEFVRR